MLFATAVLAPLLGSMVALLFGRQIGDRAAQAVTILCMILAAVCGVSSFIALAYGGASPGVVTLATWVSSGDFTVAWALRYDMLSAVMVAMVTFIATLIHIYSVGYMGHEPHGSVWRFFSYLSLFTFAMLMLITSDNLLQLFFGWEGVGLASYLLIGYWYQKPSACAAAIKAFIVNRVGDLGFALGIALIFVVFGSITFDAIFAGVAAHQKDAYSLFGASFRAYEVIGILLFIGAMGKSAQLGLHVWLPDAMEGPTPVSALIHAATMVTAGVFLMARMSPVLEYAPYAMGFVTLVGASTALFAATVGCVQNDIKRIIAYSTCSQLGYMFFAAGVGAYQAAMFHLFTHAFFKALLFLGAGSVIHGMHHEQDMRKMGGLWKLLPVTYAVMTIGTIAITGLGIPGVGGLAGFYSKDSIIESAFASFTNGHSAMGLFAFFVGILAAGLTAYYSWRLVFMTFHNKPVWKDAHHDDHAHDDHVDDHHAKHADDHAHDDHAHDDHAHHGPLKPHESPPVMLVPLLLLAVGAIAAGFVFAPWFIGDYEHDFWRGAIFVSEANHVLHDSHYVPVWVKWSPLILTLIGSFAAFWLYVMKEGMARRMADRGGIVHGFLYNKWYFDELYDVVFVKGARAVGDLFWKVGDVKIIDGGGPNGMAWLSRKLAGGLSRFQSGYVYFYAFVMLLGLAGFLAFAIYTWGA